MQNELIKMPIADIPINVKIVSNKEVDLSSNSHFHEQLELLKIIKGKLSYSLDNQTFDLGAGEIVFINSRIPHSTKVLEQDTDILIIQFDSKNLFKNKSLNSYKYLSAFLTESSKTHFIFNSSDATYLEITIVMEKIKDEFINSNNGFEFYLKSYIYMILGCLYRYEILKKPKIDFEDKVLERLRLAPKYIEDNYTENITLKELCELCGFDHFYFCRLFKRATNRTFIEYLNFIRIVEAEKLLTFSNKTITDISSDVGFSSPSYFNKTFKKYKGCNPSVYRRYEFLK